MTVGLDTSVVLRLLVGEPREQAEAARRFLRDANEPVLVSDLVMAETYFALRTHYGVHHKDAVDVLMRFFAGPRVRAVGKSREALAQALRLEQPGLIDHLIHADYRGTGATLLTLDRDAARLENARLLR